MPGQSDLADRLWDKNSLHGDFKRFVNDSITYLLPPVCRALIDQRQPDIIAISKISGQKFNLNYVIRDGTSGRRLDKQELPEELIIKQALNTYVYSRRELLARLHFMVETREYFFEYSI